MKTLTQEQINKILEEHKHWLAEDCSGWENMRADFSNCDLSSADLSYANLYSANLSSADLSYANLYSANLNSANLRSANLRSANLRSANLSFADLRSANLSFADLRSANLSSADLSYANLYSADLYSAKNIAYIPMICPEEGDFIGWKKAGNKIVKLYIPEDALRSSSTTRKCRCNKAKVIEIYNLDGTISEERMVDSDRDSDFIYEVGKIVEVKEFDTNRWEECTRGIYFFINRQEAINYI